MSNDTKRGVAMTERRSYKGDRDYEARHVSKWSAIYSCLWVDTWCMGTYIVLTYIVVQSNRAPWNEIWVCVHTSSGGNNRDDWLAQQKNNN